METKPDILEVDANCSTMEAKEARNGVGICVRNHKDKVLEVRPSLDRVITAVKLVLSDNVWNFISAYAPQVGCDEAQQMHTGMSRNR